MKNGILKLIQSNPLLRRRAMSFARSLLRSNSVIGIDVSNDARGDFVRLIQRVRQDNALLLTDAEAYCLCVTAVATGKVAGHVAEVGVFRGGSARLLAELKGDRRLYLFDTFAGLPELNAFDKSDFFFRGQFNETSREHVERVLKPFKHVEIHQGLFPDTAGPVANEVFSFVHLDVDLHRSTVDALAFFYPRMARGGVIISHDYINADGVRKAFDDFFIDKPEVLFTITESQVLVVKT